MVSSKDVYTFSGPLSASPRLLGQSCKVANASKVSGCRTPVKSTYFALGGSQASLYIGPGCDLRSALIQWVPSSEEEVSKDTLDLGGSFSSQQHT